MPATSITARANAEKSNAEQVRQLQQALGPLTGTSGLSVKIVTADGDVIPIVGDRQNMKNAAATEEFSLMWPDSTVSVGLEYGAKLLIQDTTSDRALLGAVEAAVTATLRVLEVEKREERLLEELSASWESLEALYEISTDVLRSVNIDETLKRLIDRLVSMHAGLHGALFTGHDGVFETLVSTESDLETVSLAQLGQIGRVTRELQTITATHTPGDSVSARCWRRAYVIAAAPITSRQETGILVVWSEERHFEFDSAFLRLLEAIAYQASILMERDRLNRQVRENELLAKEIEIASSIQQTLLLANTPKHVPGIEIATCSVPSQHIDGDFHDFFQHPDGSLDVIVGDVMGKGVAAALLGAGTKSQLLRSIANLSLRSTSVPPTPEAIVLRAASRISKQLISLERFVTMCYARFELKTNILHLVDCGHTSTIVSRKAEDCVFLRSNDLPLGVLQPYECTQLSFPCLPGDTYLFYSDGVTETRSSDGELFGADRLADCVQHWSSLGPALLVEQIRKEAQRFSGSQQFSDDFTCIAIRIKIAPDVSEPLSSVRTAYAAETSELSSFRAWLHNTISGPSSHFGEEDIARAELACSELFVNFAKHKDLADDSEPIRVEVRSYPDHVTVRMMHKGPVFDPLSIPAPSFDGSRDGGFGTYIVLQSADEAKYERNQEGTNLVTVSFRRTTSNNSHVITH